MRVRRFAVVAAAVAVIGLGASSAQAVTPGTEPAVDALATHSLVSTGAVSMPTAKTVDAGGVTITLPAAGNTTKSRNTTTVGSTLKDTSLAIQKDETGATRIMSIATSAAAPRDVRYRFAGATLNQQTDGTIIIQKNGELAGYIAAPWALDANGAQVPTSYIVKGDTVIQRTYFDSRTVFPVVSDPSVSGCLWGFLPALCIKYSRTETARINTAATVGIGTATSALCDKLPKAYKIACTALVAARFYDMVSKVNQAQSQRRCLLMKFPYPILPGYVTYYVVNC